MSRKLVEFTKNDAGNLVITLLPEGRAELQEKIDDHDAVKNPHQHPLDPDAVFLDLIEYQLCNGWETIQPEECGALTDGLLVTDDAQRDDDGKLTALGRVYWDERYAIRSAAKELYETGKTWLLGRD